MPRIMRRFSHALTMVLIGGLFLSIVQGFVPYDPFFPGYAYPYPYAPYYIAANNGEVKIEANHKFAEVYIDGAPRQRSRSRRSSRLTRQP